MKIEEIDPVKAISDVREIVVNENGSDLTNFDCHMNKYKRMAETVSQIIVGSAFSYV